MKTLLLLFAVAALLAVAVLRRREPIPPADLSDLGPLGWRDYERVDGV